MSKTLRKLLVNTYFNYNKTEITLKTIPIMAKENFPSLRKFLIYIHFIQKLQMKQKKLF